MIRTLAAKPREHFANISGLGVVRVKGRALRLWPSKLEPRDFEAIDDRTVRAVCPALPCRCAPD